MGARVYQPVVAYIWKDPVTGFHDLSVPKDLFWNGSLQEIDGRCYIVREEACADWPEPAAEELACGHEQPIRQFRNRNYYNNRRRCDACAALAGRLR